MRFQDNLYLVYEFIYIFDNSVHNWNESSLIEVTDVGIATLVNDERYLHQLIGL